MIRKIGKQLVARKCRRDERGSALPIIMLLSVVLLGMAALAVDIMYAYVASTQAQTAANAAALAGASKLPVNDIQSAKALAVEYAAKNVIIGESVSLNPETDIQFGYYDRNTQTFTVSESNPDTIRIFVRRTRATGNPLNMFFAHVLGFGAVDISNYAAATMPNKYVMLCLDRSGSMGYDIAEYSGNSLYWRTANKWYSKSSGSYQLATGDYYSQELGQFTIQSGNPYGQCVSEKQGTFQVTYVGNNKYDLPVSTAGQKIGRPTVPSPGGWTYYASSGTWYSEYLGDFFSTPSNGYKWKYTPGRVYAWSGKRYYLRGLEEPIQPFTDVQNAASTFVDRLNLIKDKTGVASFGSDATLDLVLSQDYDTIMQYIDTLEPGGYTNTPGAIDLSVQELTSDRAIGFSQKVMILVSDGRPRSGSISQSEMRQATLDAAAVAAEEGILIYTVTVGKTAEVDVDLMIAIANMTGGAQYHTTNSENLSSIFNEIFERIPPRLVGILEEDISVGGGDGGGDGQMPPPPSGGGSGDVDGSISPDFYDTVICYGTVDQSTGDTTPWAKMYVNATSDDEYIYAALEFDKAFADNTYGANSSGYYKKDKKTGVLMPRAHNFKDLVGSDRTLFQVTDGDGNLALEFYVDYISADTQADSGYSSLGIWGGDGSMVAGDPSYIVEANSSLSWNLARYPSVIVDSPATDASYTPNANYPDWIYEVAYEVKIAKTAFGTAGFGSISIPYVHASPSKLGFNTLDVTIIDCPPSDGGSSPPPSDSPPSDGDTPPPDGGSPSTPPGEGGGGSDTPPSDGSSPPSDGGGSGDVDGSISPDFYDTVICYGTVDQSTSETTQWAKMFVNATSDPDYIYAALEFDKAFADNTYGANSSGYYKKDKKTGQLTPKTHDFDALVGSDRTLFQVTDGNGNLVLEFYVDYISADVQAASGYSSLGIWGGDGSMVSGDPSYVAEANTSLSWNLTRYSSMIVDSPATDDNYTPNPDYPDWIYEVAYEVKIAKAAFGTAGFGSISIPYVHASPSKLGFNTLDVQIIDCPPSDGGSGTPPPSSGGGSGDVDGAISPDFYDTVICYGAVDQSTNQTTKWAKMFVNATSDPDYIYAALEFDKAFADNTYGANSSGYYKKDKKTGQLTPKTHDFDALVGSDRTLFQVTDGNGNLVLEFYVDYISADAQAASGYSSLGIWGGDGSMVSGDPSYIAAASTSISWNLAHYPSMIVDSPATDADYTPNPNYPDWIYEVAYEVKIAKAAFGTAGFGSISIPYVHASPSKLGFNTLDVGIVDCVDIQLNGFNVTYEGKTYDSVGGQTTFAYNVEGTGVPPALSYFIVGLCQDANVVSYSPTGTVEIGTDPNTGIYGIKWEVPLEPTENREYSVTLQGNYSGGIVQVAVKGGPGFEAGEITGPACESSGGGSTPPPDATAQFTVNRLDVKVGDTFKLSDYVERTPATLGIGTDITFYYKNGTTPVADWRLDDFNNDNSITIVSKDRKGHSVGQKKGKYRVYMAIAGQDGPADHITIRVKKKKKKKK